MYKPRSLKHIRRYRQIISVFTKYGLKDLITYVQTLRLPRPLARPQIVKETAVNLRLALQELGPTFIKAGQLLSSRSDLLPKIVTDELQKLLDEVAPVDYAELKQKLGSQLGKNLEDIFLFIEEKPLASASLAQVHKAKLKDNSVVALKIQRPNIKELINMDIDILYDFAAILRDRISYLKAYNLKEIVAEFERNLKREMDFELEGLNMETIAGNLTEFKNLKTPAVYWQFTTKEVLCLEYIKGSKVTQKERLVEAQINTKKLARQILDIYSKQIYVDGFFQADPHIGNIFISDEGIIQLIDFGSTGRLDEDLRREIAVLVFHFIFKEGEQAAESLLRMGMQKKHINYTALRNDVSRLIAEYTTLPKQYFNIGQGLLDLTRIAAKHYVEVPANFSLVGKTFLLLDNIARILDPQFSYNKYLLHLAPLLLYERLQSDFSVQRAVRNAVEAGSFAATFPGKLNYFVDKILKDDLHVIFRHEGLEKVTDGLTTAGLAIALSLIAAGLSIIATLSFLVGQKIISFIIAIVSLSLIIYLLFKMLRRIKW